MGREVFQMSPKNYLNSDGSLEIVFSSYFVLFLAYVKDGGWRIIMESP